MPAGGSNAVLHQFTTFSENCFLLIGLQFMGIARFNMKYGEHATNQDKVFTSRDDRNMNEKNNELLLYVNIVVSV